MQKFLIDEVSLEELFCLAEGLTKNEFGCNIAKKVREGCLIAAEADTNVTTVRKVRRSMPFSHGKIRGSTKKPMSSMNFWNILEIKSTVLNSEIAQSFSSNPRS